jgi:hypothetical protein
MRGRDCTWCGAETARDAGPRLHVHVTGSLST